MEELRPKRSAVKKVLTYNINYHQIGYSEQRELQRALKNSLIEAEAALKQPTVDLKKQNSTEDECCERIDDLNENSNENPQLDLECKDLKCNPPDDLALNTELEKKLSDLELVHKESIDQIIDEVISQNLSIDSNENFAFNQTSSHNTSINATINTVINNYTSEGGQSPDKEEQKQQLVNQKNIVRKKSVKKSKQLISPNKKYLFNSVNKFNKKNLCKSTLSKSKVLCSRKSVAKLIHSPNSKIRTKRKRKENQLSDENSKDDDLEFNYKDKFKKRIKLKLDGDLILKLNDEVDKSKSTPKKQCKSDKSLSDQVTNVFNDKREDFLNQLICIRKLDDAKEDLINDSIYNQLDEIDLKRTNFLDNQLIDDQLNDKLDLDNLINSLIDKLDDSSTELKSSEPNERQSNNSTNESNSLVTPFISTNFIAPLSNDKMVSNKNLASLNSTNDKHLLNYKSSTKTNGHSNGHCYGHSEKESQLNAFTSPKTKSLKSKGSKKKKDHNIDVNNKKNKTKSLYDFNFDLNRDLIKKEQDSSVSSMSSTSISIDESINAAINSVINNLSVEDSFVDDEFESDHFIDNNITKTKSTKKRAPKLFSLETCIKNEIKKKLLQKTMKLTNKKNVSKSLTTTDSLTSSKKKSASTKLNGKNDKLTKVKKEKTSSPTNGKQKDKKTSKKENKNGKTTKKQPRSPHLTKTKLNKQSSKQMAGKRKYVKKALRKRSEILIRNLYKFRRYLKIKKQELLNLDRDELSALSVLSKDYLMNCFVDSNNFEIDFDIYDPLTINGLMSTQQPFSGNNLILSNELLDNIMNNSNEDDNKSNGHISKNEDFNIPTEDDLSSQSDPSYKDTSSDSESENDDSDSSDSESSDSDLSSSISDTEDSSSSDDKSECSEESWTSASSRI